MDWFAQQIYEICAQETKICAKNLDKTSKKMKNRVLMFKELLLFLHKRLRYLTYQHNTRYEKHFEKRSIPARYAAVI
jgi:hypothetical protein